MKGEGEVFGLRVRKSVVPNRNENGCGGHMAEMAVKREEM